MRKQCVNSPYCSYDDDFRCVLILLPLGSSYSGHILDFLSDDFDRMECFDAAAPITCV